MIDLPHGALRTPRGYGEHHALSYNTERGHGFTLPGERDAWVRDLDETLKRPALDLPGKLKVMDLGCGTGNFTRLIRDVLEGLEKTLIIDGVDASEPMLEVARGDDNRDIRYHHRLDVLQIKRLLGINGPSSYDVLASRQVVDSFENPDLILKSWRSLLKPGGLLVIVDTFCSPTSWTNRSPEELARMPLAVVTSVEPLVDAITSAGFQDVCAGFLSTVTLLYGGTTAETTGTIGSRYYATARNPSA